MTSLSPPLSMIVLNRDPSEDESTLRRMFTELCKAVSWMHGVGLVHRDIKLESKFTSDFLTSLYP